MSANLRSTIGVLPIVLGLIAVPVPVLPGLPLLAAGTALLGNQHPLVRPWRVWLIRREFLKEGREQS
jgi:uncharacterized membrane protein YbaN (DUF454 family)